MLLFHCRLITCGLSFGMVGLLRHLFLGRFGVSPFCHTSCTLKPNPDFFGAPASAPAGSCAAVCPPSTAATHVSGGSAYSCASDAVAYLIKRALQLYPKGHCTNSEHFWVPGPGVMYLWCTLA
jgi:hypothetical protein